MGTSSKADYNDRCTERGPATVAGAALEHYLSVFDSPLAFNRHERREAKRRLRKACRWIMRHTPEGDRNAAQRSFVKQYAPRLTTARL